MSIRKIIAPEHLHDSAIFDQEQENAVGQEKFIQLLLSSLAAYGTMDRVPETGAVRDDKLGSRLCKGLLGTVAENPFESQLNDRRPLAKSVGVPVIRPFRKSKSAIINRDIRRINR